MVSVLTCAVGERVYKSSHLVPRSVSVSVKTYTPFLLTSSSASTMQLTTCLSLVLGFLATKSSAVTVQRVQLDIVNSEISPDGFQRE